MLEGIDLGSRDFTSVKKPEIALLVGEGVRSYDAGEIWHLLDTRHAISISKIDVKDLRQTDISRYSHFIIPSFSGSGLNSHTRKTQRVCSRRRYTHRLQIYQQMASKKRFYQT